MKQTSDEKTAYWQHYINHWQASDLSAAQYCQQHQVTYHCFIYWRNKLACKPEAAIEQTLAARKESGVFVMAQPQVSPLTEATAPEANLQLALPNWLITRDIRDGNLSTVRALLEHL